MQIYMKKLLDSDWSSAVQFFGTINLQFRAITISKLISQSKCRTFYDNHGGTNCPCTHELSQANKPIKMQGLIHRCMNRFSFD